MSVAIDFLLQLSLLCRRELSVREERTDVKQFEPPHCETNSLKAVSNDSRENRCLQNNTIVKCEDDSSQNGVRKCPKSDLKVGCHSPLKPSESLKSPEKNEIRDSRNPYYCVQCKVSLRRNGTYQKHLKTDKHLGLMPCEKCTKKFSYNDMEKHLNSVHSTSSPLFKTCKRLDDGNILCTKCDLMFSTFGDYRKHATSVDHKGKLCSRCNFRTQSAEEMEKHFRDIHGNQNKQTCKLCGSGYASPFWLERHMKTAHSVKKNFECSICKETFGRQDNLRRHEAEKHSTKRPFPCEICGLSFKYKRNVVQHMRVHKENRHQCAICFRSFKDPIDLENHEKVHAGAMFNCMVCGKSFATYHKRECHLSRHMNSSKEKGQKKKKTINLKSTERYCDSKPSILSSSAGSSSAGHCSSKNEHENISLENAACEVAMTAITLPVKCKEDVRCSVKKVRFSRITEHFSSRTNGSREENVIKTETGDENKIQKCLPRKKASALDAKLDNVTYDKPCKENIRKVETSFSPVITLTNSLSPKDLVSERVKPTHPKKVHPVKRNYPDALKENSVKRRKRNNSSKENSPVPNTEDVTLDKNSVSERVNPSKIFKEARRNVSRPFNFPGKRKENLRKISEHASNVLCCLTEEEQIAGQVSKNSKSKEELENNSHTVSLKRSAMSKTLVNPSPKSKSVESEKKCDSNVIGIIESECLSKAVGIVEDCPIKGQIAEIQNCSGSGEENVVVELNNTDLTFISRPCFVSGTVIDCKTSEITVDSASQQPVLIDDCLTVMSDILTIPIDSYITEVDSLDTAYIVRDTDSGVSLLNAEDLTQDKIFTFTASDECIEASVGYSFATAKSVSKKSQKKQNVKREPRKGKNGKYKCEDSRKVLVRNLVSNSDDFYLPEFVIEEDSN